MVAMGRPRVDHRMGRQARHRHPPSPNPIPGTALRDTRESAIPDIAVEGRAESNKPDRVP